MFQASERFFLCGTMALFRRVFGERFEGLSITDGTTYLSLCLLARLTCSRVLLLSWDNHRVAYDRGARAWGERWKALVMALRNHLFGSGSQR